jgi:hypothetical protein
MYNAEESKSEIGISDVDSPSRINGLKKRQSNVSPNRRKLRQ